MPTAPGWHPSSQGGIYDSLALAANSPLPAISPNSGARTAQRIPTVDLAVRTAGFLESLLPGCEPLAAPGVNNNRRESNRGLNRGFVFESPPPRREFNSIQSNPIQFNSIQFNPIQRR
eukprot:3759472-Pyramimonas_sp.AAC.1